MPSFGGTEYDPLQRIPYTAFASQLSALARAQDAGKVRAWGVSNETAWGVAKWASTAEKLRVGAPAAVQNAYNLLCRSADSSGLAEACTEERVPLHAYSPLAMGLLTGKYTPREGSARPGLADLATSGRQGQQQQPYALGAPAQRSAKLQWDGPPGSRLVRYRGRYAEDEARCGIMT